jgi:hypothetical protein
MNTENNNPLERLEQIINSVLQLKNNEINELNISLEDWNTLTQLQELVNKLNREISGITTINKTLGEIDSNLEKIQTKNTDQNGQQILPIWQLQELKDLKTQLGEVDYCLKSIYGNSGKSLYDLYDIYRDHIKHEDNLGNARINILLASQSFLFFPYFSILKDYRNNGYSGYDSLLLFGICSLGIGINVIVRPSVRGFIDASSHIGNVWKDKISKTKNDSMRRYDIKLDKLATQAQDSPKKPNSKRKNEDIGFIDIDTKEHNPIPNIRYENPTARLRLQMQFFTNQLPLWLIIIWIALFIIPVFGFSNFSNNDWKYSWEKIWDSSEYDPNSKPNNQVTLEGMLNTIYEAELNKKIEGEKQNTENKTKDELTKKLEGCRDEIITANPPMTNVQIKEKLDSCFTEK